MVFGFFQKPTFEDHFDRLDEKLWDAHGLIFDLDRLSLEITNEICHEQFELRKKHTWLRKKLVSVLSEGLWIAKQAIKTSNKDPDKLFELKMRINADNWAKQITEQEWRDGNSGFYFKDPKTSEGWINLYIKGFIAQYNECFPPSSDYRIGIRLLPESVENKIKHPEATIPPKLVICPKCGAGNRVMNYDPSRFRPKCGKCGSKWDPLSKKNLHEQQNPQKNNTETEVQTLVLTCRFCSHQNRIKGGYEGFTEKEWPRCESCGARL